MKKIEDQNKRIHQKIASLSKSSIYSRDKFNDEFAKSRQVLNRISCYSDAPRKSISVASLPQPSTVSVRSKGTVVRQEVRIPSQKSRVWK